MHTIILSLQQLHTYLNTPRSEYIYFFFQELTVFYYLFSAAQVVCPQGGGAVQGGQGAGGGVRGAGVGQGRGPPIQRKPKTIEESK